MAKKLLANCTFMLSARLDSKGYFLFCPEDEGDLAPYRRRCFSSLSKREKYVSARNLLLFLEEIFAHFQIFLCRVEKKDAVLLFFDVFHAETLSRAPFDLLITVSFFYFSPQIVSSEKWSHETKTLDKCEILNFLQIWKEFCVFCSNKTDSLFFYIWKRK